ncbi:MAG: hypothetical protein ACYSWO_21790 [Planctomycetota bacterium]|jgi:hypothetical protein
MSPIRSSTPPFTHYSYLRGPSGEREPTGVFNLDGELPHSRRKLIAYLNRQGELLAENPLGKVENMKALRAQVALWEKHRR